MEAILTGIVNLSWQLEHVVDTAQEIHERPWPNPLVPTVWHCDVTSPSLVLGITQGMGPDIVQRAQDADVALCRRSSGGAAVWLSPKSSLWIDVFVPVGHVAFRQDIGKAAVIVGRAWQSALWRIGHSTAVHDGPMVKSANSAAWCFDGLGAGEVSDLGTGGKIIGISQRRSRRGSRFQCVGYLVDDTATGRSLVELPSEEPLRSLRTLNIGSESEIVQLISYFVAELPA